MDSSAPFLATARQMQRSSSTVLFNEISANFFTELGIPILAGRDFVNSDADANTCIVSQAAARKFFSHGTALGHTLRQYQMSMDTGSSSTDDCEVIGVVADAKLMDLRRPAEATIYRPIAGDFSNPGLWNFVIQAHSLADARSAYLNALHELAPGKPEFDLIPFTVQLDDSVSIEQLLAQLSGFFAVAGFAVERDRNLRVGGVECDAAHARDRGADGAGCYAAACARTGDATGGCAVSGGCGWPVALGRSLRRGRSGVSCLRCSRGIQRSLRHLHWGWFWSDCLRRCCRVAVRFRSIRCRLSVLNNSDAAGR